MIISEPIPLFTETTQSGESPTNMTLVSSDPTTMTRLTSTRDQFASGGLTGGTSYSALASQCLMTFMVLTYVIAVYT